MKKIVNNKKNQKQKKQKTEKKLYNIDTRI